MMASGQHFAYAMPESPMTEWIVASPPGVPLSEVVRIPGMPIPKDGRVVPSDAPGFGYELRPEHFLPFTPGAPINMERAN
jgi:L-rhamnonate dehydratase